MNKMILLIVWLVIFSIKPCVSQSIANYDITFTSIWNAEDHNSVPPNAHWSKLVGVTHKTANTFLQIGNLATIGIKNIAETGSNDVFNGEVTTAIATGEADKYIDGPSLGSATGEILISNVEVNKDFPLLTLVSMIAPSPDWVIALNGYNLLDTEGKWKTSVNLDMFAYDAGTDSGTDYTSTNMVSNPFQFISMINGLPINGKKMGTLSITLVLATKVDNLSLINKISLYPNPVSNGKVTIGNLEEISLTKVDVYNSLGLLVKSIGKNLKQNTLIIDVQDLSPGIYLLKIATEQYKTITRKLVIK